MFNLLEKPNILQEINSILEKEKQIPMEELREKLWFLDNQPMFTIDKLHKGGLTITSALLIVAFVVIIIMISRQNAQLVPVIR